jgi:hypothetical protein
MFLKGQCHEILCSGFFHESVSDQPQSISFGPILAGQSAPPVSTTPVANLPPVLTTTTAANNGNNYQIADNFK